MLSQLKLFFSFHLISVLVFDLFLSHKLKSFNTFFQYVEDLGDFPYNPLEKETVSNTVSNVSRFNSWGTIPIFDLVSL